ncbi:hypothetical protein AC578_10321 [Pseudocercospora eumusae]|uniref:Uncharacterized protein n=1 Tax=Pseudocercospora eumusae TaxID=321146 RepID=A0A139HRC5_9PEZI|nr:hypothetical protein AC578_10321 [Pseudocercospora eumusae]
MWNDVSQSQSLSCESRQLASSGHRLELLSGSLACPSTPCNIVCRDQSVNTEATMADLEIDACYCQDCIQFGHRLEYVRGLFPSYSGDARVDRALVAARASIREAWFYWQDRRGHNFVPQQEHSNGEEHFDEDEYGLEDRGGEVYGRRDSYEDRYSEGEDYDGEEVQDEREDATGEANYRDRVDRSSFSSQGRVDEEVIYRFEDDTITSDSSSGGAVRVANEDFERSNVEVFYRGVQTRTRAHGITDPEHVENGGHHEKFMVCDHCIAHGLPCNEAAVCDQCQLFEQPCIHRWCPNSRDSKADCSNNACRYTHRDSITTTEGEPTWIVVYGNFLGH